MIQSRGEEGEEEDEEDDAHDKIVSCTIERRHEAVQRLVAGGIWFNKGVLKLGRNVAVHGARLTTALNATEHLRVIHNAVLLTVGGRGTPGVHAEVAAYRDKPEVCVL